MFPKPRSPHRGTVGTITGTAGRPSERSNGKIWLSPIPTFTAVDAADQQQWEYWDGSGWQSAANASVISNLDYEIGIQWRTRLVNGYFQYFSSYITSAAATFRETDGISAFETVLDALGGWGTRTTTYNAGTEVFSTTVNNVPTELRSAYNYPGGIYTQWSGNLRHPSYPIVPDISFAFTSPVSNPSGATATMSLDITGLVAPFVPNGTWTAQTFWAHTYPDGPIANGNSRSSTFTP